MALPLVTIQGHVLTPAGEVPNGGTISCRLVSSGSALSGAEWDRLTTEAIGTISPAGAVTLSLVPNDAISPSGTVYAVRFKVLFPNGREDTWTETWQLASAPNPVDIGAITRVAAGGGVTYVAGPAGPAGSSDLIMSWMGRPIAGEMLARIKIAHGFTVPAGATGSQGAVGTNPTVPATVTIRRNGAAVATANISTGGVVTWTCAAPIPLVAGDLVTFEAQAVADATLADISLTLAGPP